MQITAACPKCDSRYQFDAALLGQKIRCTNPKCREVFVVAEVPEEAPPRPAVGDRRAPTFDADSGEYKAVPAAEKSRRDEGGRRDDGPREADWSKLPPPPVRKRDEAPAVEDELVVAEAEPGRASADEVLAFMGVAAAPAAEEDYALPVDVVEGEEIYEVVAEDEGELDYGDLYRQYRKPKRRWIAFAMLFFFLLTAGGVAGVFIYVKGRKTANEQKVYEEAEQSLRDNKFKNAERLFDELLKNQNNKNVGKYRFLRDYARAMESATDPSAPTDARRASLIGYLGQVRDSSDPNADLVKDHQGEIRNAFVIIADDQVREADKKANAKEFAEARKAHDDALKTQSFIRQYTPADVKPVIPPELEQRYAALAEKIAEGQRFEDFRKSVEERLAKAPSPDLVSKIEDEAKKNGYGQRPEVFEMIKAAKDALVKRIAFQPDERPAAPVPPGELVSLIIGPNTDRVPEKPAIIFAVARGVLYALADHKGQVLWATRVGIDTSALPLRVPGTGNMPETVLVPTADGQGLIAREVLTGKPRWMQRLAAPIRGRPILAERRVYVPLTDDKGKVAVLEARDGQQLGYIELGQRIGAGAAAQEGSSYLFVPADSQNVFILDANPENANGAPVGFVAMLPTGHGPGSLRGEPVVVGGADEATGKPAGVGYLLLAQSDGFAHMKLRSFVLTYGEKLVQIIPSVETSLPGWTWFAPVCDQEKVAVVTDAGAFALLGINQKDNQDPTLFPLLVEQPKEGAANAAGRGQVVHTEEHGFWYLAGGELNYVRMGFHSKDGMKLAPGWKNPLKLGTPLHASQVSADRSTLYVVTQTISPPSWLATAVSAQSGEIIWQRPLGLAVQGDPIKLGEVVYQLDQGAGIYAVDPKATPNQAGQEWPLAGQVLAAPRHDVVGESYLLPTADGKMAYAVYATEDGRKLNAVVLVPGQKAGPPASVGLAAPLAGPPILAEKTLVMALTDGGLHRWTIGDKEVKRGPDWRGPRLGESARAFLTPLGKDDYLVTDGHRGLTVYTWPTAGEHQLKTQLNVPDRIVSAPVVLPVKEGTPRVAVADAGGRLNLLEGDPLSPTLKWEMKALRKGSEITAGPFVIDVAGQPRLLVVADRSTLVCLTPEERKEYWSAKIKGDGVDGRPRQVGGTLVVADVSGRYEALEAETGKPTGASYPLLTALPAAPAATPIEFGPDRLFAPLTDGTVLLIPGEALLPKK